MQGVKWAPVGATETSASVSGSGSVTARGSLNNQAGKFP